MKLTNITKILEYIEKKILGLCKSPLYVKKYNFFLNFSRKGGGVNVIFKNATVFIENITTVAYLNGRVHTKNAIII